MRFAGGFSPPGAAQAGSAATIRVGSVTSGTTASVTNSGTSTAAVFDFVLPAGKDAPTNGRLQLVGNLNVTETLLISLAVGMKRKDFPLAGVTSADANKLLLVPNGTPTAGCEAVNAYPGATSGTVSIGYYTPLLGIGSTYSIPVSVWRITS